MSNSFYRATSVSFGYEFGRTGGQARGTAAPYRRGGSLLTADAPESLLVQEGAEPVSPLLTATAPADLVVRGGAEPVSPLLTATAPADLAVRGGAEPISPLLTATAPVDIVVRGGAEPVSPLFTSTAPTDLTTHLIDEVVVGTGAGDGPTAETAESRSVIDLDDFAANPLYWGINGAGVTVAILDTGADLNHSYFGPDADHNGIADRIVYQYDYAYDDGSAEDGDGHGSNVMGIVGSSNTTYAGMAPGVNFIVLKVLDDDGSGTSTDLEQALQWLAANGAAYNLVAVNMSLGFGDNDNTSQTWFLTDECQALVNQGVAVVSAAGNSYYTYQTPGSAYPGSDPYSWSVGAVYDASLGSLYYASGAIDYSTSVDQICSFSQRSTTMVDIFAPGALITNAGANGTTVSYTGTSQAAPHIAGIVALMQDLSLEISGQRIGVDTLRTLMRASAVTIYDGDNENDNVTNTNTNYLRVDVDGFAARVVQYWQTATTGADTLYGWRGNDTMNGLAGNDTIYGRGGNDTITGGGGTDTIDGGAGWDKAMFTGTIGTASISRNTTTNTWTITSGGQTSILTNVEVAQFSNGTRALRERPAADFNADNRSDILWRNTSSGSIGYWQMSGGSPQLVGLSTVASSWTISGSGDFNADGGSEILWRNSNGLVGYWNVAGSQPQFIGLATVGNDWSIAGTGDFNVDGRTDVLWRSSNGGIGYWTLSGSQPQLVGLASVGNDWDVSGVGDFNADGRSDILWRNDNGQVGYWNLSTASPTFVGLASVGNDWTIAGTGDFNADGQTDVLWQNDSGWVGYWNMASGQVQFTGLAGVGHEWSIAGTGDYNTDGRTDVLWRNAGGGVSYWNLTAGQPQLVNLATVDSSWQIQPT